MKKRKSATITLIKNSFGIIRLIHGRSNRALYRSTDRWVAQLLRGPDYESSMRLSLVANRKRSPYWKYIMCVGRFADTVLYAHGFDYNDEPNFDLPIIAFCADGLLGLFGHIPTHISYKEKA